MVLLLFCLFISRRGKSTILIIFKKKHFLIEVLFLVNILSPRLFITDTWRISQTDRTPQENVDFYSGVLGLSLVKQTVNFDDPIKVVT